jgi:hypothetical protein
VTTFYAADGVAWPYSHEVTAGVEHELPRNMRVGVMYNYRTNRKHLGVRNIAVPTSAYTPFTPHRPRGPLEIFPPRIVRIGFSLDF